MRIRKAELNISVVIIRTHLLKLLTRGERAFEFKTRVVDTLAIGSATFHDVVSPFNLYYLGGGEISLPLTAFACANDLIPRLNVHALSIEGAEISDHIQDIEGADLAWVPILHFEVKPVGVTFGIGVHFKE